MELLLEYLRVLLSAPPMAAAVALTFIVMFQSEIRAFISRLRSVKFGGGEFAAPQQAAMEPAPPPPEPAAEEIERLNTILRPEDVERLQALFEAERFAGQVWEFRYLNYFLASTSQVVLQWLANIGKDTTRTAYDTMWSGFSTSERAAVLQALEAHGLVEVRGPGICITDKGRQYVGWSERRWPPPSSVQPGPAAA